MKEQALARATKEHPELYKRYLEVREKPPEEITELEAIAVQTFFKMIYFIELQMGQPSQRTEMYE